MQGRKGYTDSRVGLEIYGARDWPAWAWGRRRYKFRDIDTCFLLFNGLGPGTDCMSICIRNSNPTSISSYRRHYVFHSRCPAVRRREESPRSAYYRLFSSASLPRSLIAISVMRCNSVHLSRPSNSDSRLVTVITCFRPASAHYFAICTHFDLLWK
jgi:hypothetical protein